MIFGGKVRAVELERMDKIKHSSFYGSKRHYSLDDYLCAAYTPLLDEAKEGEGRVLYAVNHTPRHIGDFIAETKPYTVLEHHYLHACSAYYGSGFADAAVLTVDGSGQSVSRSTAESQTIWAGKGNELRQLHSQPSSFWGN